MKVSNKYRLRIIYNSWWSWERLVRNKWCWNNSDHNNFRHAFFEFLCVVFIPRWKDSLILFCFFLFFFGKVLFVLRFSKHFKVHCNAFEKSLGHSTFPHGKITWFETIDTCKHQNVCYPYSFETLTLACTKPLQMFFVSQSIGEKWFCIFC